jgi:MOSC domain-containing protein YiiM
MNAMKIIHIYTGEGLPKNNVQSAILTSTGFVGDKQRGENHGPPYRDIVIWSLNRIQELIKDGHPILPGACGENLVVDGEEYFKLKEDDILTIGNSILKLTFPAGPCNNIKEFFTSDMNKIHDTMPRWCCDVIYADNKPITIGNIINIRKK